MRDREIKKIEEGKSLFQTVEQYDFFKWFDKYALDFHDEGCSGFHEAAKLMGLPEEVAEWAERVSMQTSALEAGIPLSVVLGKTKLRDHFSQDYIDYQSGK